MTKFILCYFLGLAVIINLVAIWKYTTFKCLLANLWFLVSGQDRTLYTDGDFEEWSLDWASGKKGLLKFIGDEGCQLLSCSMCLSTHLSLITATTVVYFSGVYWPLILAGAFTWPWMANLVTSAKWFKL